jgi:acetyl-CoA carboxylase biotin carboxyl carrier protein
MAGITSPVAGSVWKVEVEIGDQVRAGQTLVILESMKMEIPIEAEAAGQVAEISCSAGDTVAEGTVLVVVN